MKNSNINSDKISIAKDISKALESGDMQGIKNVGLSDDKLSKLMGILQDEEKINKIMTSSDAQTLLKKFGKE